MSDLQVRGPLAGSTGAPSPFTADLTGASRITDAHGRFQEATRLQRMFSTGMTTTSISNVTFTTATLGATCTPIVGVWNPVGTGKIAVILQARLQVIITALARQGPGAFMWCSAVNQSAITVTALVPWNRYSLAQTGSVCKGFANTALTGLSGNLSIMEASGVGGGPNIVSQTDVLGMGPFTQAQIDNIDGAYFLLPGGLLALLCTTTPIAMSAASSLMWEEIDYAL